VAKRPYCCAFWDERALPSGVTGLRESAPLARAALRACGATPLPAVVNLFKLLDRHAELLRRIDHRGAAMNTFRPLGYARVGRVHPGLAATRFSRIELVVALPSRPAR
jgi:hypothetical protein